MENDEPHDQGDEIQNSARFKGAVRLVSLMHKKTIQDEEMFRVNKALIKPYSIRSREDLECIEKVMMKVKFFMKLKLRYGLLIFKEVCKYVYYKRCQPNTTIIRINKEGDTFYVIVRGSVGINIYLPRVQKKKLERRETLVDIPELLVEESLYDQQEVNILQAGDSFGELALLDSTQKTTANVITKETCEFACLDKEQYLMILGVLNQAEMNEKMNFVRNIHFLQGWFENDLKTLSFHFECQYYDRKETIFKESDALDGYLYFLKRGEVVLTKLDKKQQIMVCKLSIGEVFGEEDFLNVTSRQFTATCTEQNTQVYLLLKSDLEKRMWQASSRKAFKESISIRWRWRMVRYNSLQKAEIINDKIENHQLYINPDNNFDEVTKNQNRQIRSVQSTKSFDFLSPTKTLQYLEECKHEQKMRTRPHTNYGSGYTKQIILDRQKLMSQCNQQSTKKDIPYQKFKRANVIEMKQHLLEKFDYVEEQIPKLPFNFITQEAKEEHDKLQKLSRQSSGMNHQILINEVSQFVSSKNSFYQQKAYTPSHQPMQNEIKIKRTLSSNKHGNTSQQKLAKNISTTSNYEVQESKSHIRFKRVFQF